MHNGTKHENPSSIQEKSHMLSIIHHAEASSPWPHKSDTERRQLSGKKIIQGIVRGKAGGDNHELHGSTVSNH